MSQKATADSQTSAFVYLLPVLAILLVAALMIVLNGGIQIGFSNHTGLLPVVRRILDPAHLPDDFGILLREYHHRPFAYLVAGFAYLLGEDAALLCLKIIATVMLSGSLYALCRALQLSTVAFLALGVLVAANTGLTGQGVETNTFIGNREVMPTTLAHACVLFAVAALLGRRWRLAAFLAGLTMLWHLQIGFALTLLLLPFYLARYRESGWKEGLVYAGLFLLPAARAFWDVAQMMERGLVSLPFSLADILFRQPAHFVLKSWMNAFWVTLHLAAVAGVWLWQRRQGGGATRQGRRAANVLLVMSLMIATLCGAHFVDFYLLEWGGLVKFQFLRMSVLLTVFGALAVVWLINEFAVYQAAQSSSTSSAQGFRQPLANVALMALALGLFAFPATRQTLDKPSFAINRYDRQATDWAQVCLWVKENAPPQALFLTPPGNQGFAYLAQRSTVVEFKINPDGPQFLSAWYARLTDVAGGSLPDKQGFANFPLLNQAYAALTADEMLRLKEKYGASYAVLLQPAGAAFETVFENASYRVVRL